jgi:hypothetical protein
MAGARIIYDVVKSKRSALGLDTKPFAKWAGLEFDVDQIVAGERRVFWHRHMCDNSSKHIRD